MIRKQKRVVKKYKKLPPHSDEPHPIAHAGEVSKPFLISVITIVLLVLISLLLFFGDTFTGKAVHFEEFTPTGNQGGIFDKDNKIEFEEVGDSFNFPVSVHSTTDSSAVRFVVVYDPTIVSVECPDVSALDKLFNDGELKLHSNVQCIPGEIRYEYAALSLGGEVEGTEVVAKLNVKALKEGKTTLDFSDFEIYDAKTGDELKVTSTSPEVIVGFKGCKEEKVAVNKVPITITSQDLPVLLKDGTFGVTPYTQKITASGVMSNNEWNSPTLTYEVNFATPVSGTIKTAKGEGGDFKYVTDLHTNIEFLGKKYIHGFTIIDNDKSNSAGMIWVPEEDMKILKPGQKAEWTINGKKAIVEYVKFDQKPIIKVDGEEGHLDDVLFDNFGENAWFGVPHILDDNRFTVFISDDVLIMEDNGVLWINEDDTHAAVTVEDKVEGETYSFTSFKVEMRADTKLTQGRLSDHMVVDKKDPRALMNNLLDAKLAQNTIQVGKLCPPYTPTKKIKPVELDETPGFKDLSALLTELEFTYKGKVWVTTEVFDPNNNDVAYKREMLDALPAKFEQKISYANENNVAKKIVTVRNDKYQEIKKHEKKYTK